jgi:steroid delta-isomerase-like uncharacterized protein
MLDLIKRSLDTFAASDWDGFKACFAPDAVYEEYATRRRVTGADEIAALDKGWKAAFPDAAATVKSSYTAGDTEIVEVEWEATNTGALETAAGTLPATNKRVKVGAVLINKIRNGKIVELHQYFDMLGLMQQLGVPVIGAEKPKAEQPVFH